MTMITRHFSENKIINFHVTSGPENCNLGPKIGGILPVFGKIRPFTSVYEFLITRYHLKFFKFITTDIVLMYLNIYIDDGGTSGL